VTAVTVPEQAVTNAAVAIAQVLGRRFGSYVTGAEAEGAAREAAAEALTAAAPLLGLANHADHDRRVAAAERERIRRLAVQHGAVCDVAEVTQDGRRVGGRTRAFADLLGGDRP